MTQIESLWLHSFGDLICGLFNQSSKVVVKIKIVEKKTVLDYRCGNTYYTDEQIEEKELKKGCQA